MGTEQNKQIGTQSDDWKSDAIKDMEDQSEEDIHRCGQCGEPFHASEKHDCKNDAGEERYEERKREWRSYKEREAQDKADYERRNR